MFYNEWNEINDILDESERIKRIENERAYPLKKAMTDKEAIETAKQIIEATNKLIDYCRETGGCKNCIFAKYSSTHGCNIKTQYKLEELVSKYEKQEGYYDRT